MARSYTLLLALLLGLSPLSACEDDSGAAVTDTQPSATSQHAEVDVSFAASTLPGVDALRVTLGTIRLGTSATRGLAPQPNMHRVAEAGPDKPDPDPQGTGANGEVWVTVVAGPITLDVLHPTQGATQLIGHAQVAATAYEQVEVEVLGAVLVRNGVETPVALQPGAATRLRVDHVWTALANAPANLTVGLDLTASAEMLLAATPSWRPQASAQAAAITP